MGTEKDKLSDAARTMSKHGSSKGGLASAQKLTAKQRRDKAIKAVMARWKKKKRKALDITQSA